MIVGIDHTRLVRFAETIVGRQDAEDVVQEVYVKFLSGKVPQFRGDSERETWVMSVVKHTAYRWRETQMPSIAGPVERSYTPNYDDWIDAKTQIAHLHPDYREVLLLFAMHGSSRSVAKVLRLKPRQVENRLARARKQLRERLA